MEKSFEALEKAEETLQLYQNSGLTPIFSELKALLAYERLLDVFRSRAFEEYGLGSDKANEYVFREYTFRHNVSKFALLLDKSETDKLTGETDDERSVMAMHIRNRELYPEPKRS